MERREFVKWDETSETPPFRLWLLLAAPKSFVIDS